MKILFATSECVPFVKTGGLADVAGALPKQLKKLGAEVRVILPLYRDVAPKWREQMEHLTYFYVNLGWRRQYCGIETLKLDGVTFYFIDNEFYYNRPSVYGWGGDEGERFAFFDRAVLEALPLIDYKPDILHCHDWQTGLIPVLLKRQYAALPFYQGIHTVFTIHNLQYQGVFGMDYIEDLMGLGWDAYTSDKLEFFGAASFMKGGLVYTDEITTVSPTYANEIQTAYYGERLDGLLRARHESLTGILNGIDVDEYNPNKDPQIVQTYNVVTQSKRKAVNKAALQEQLGLEIRPDVPLIGMVTRLSSQKGLDLVERVLPEIMSLDVQLVVLGMGEEKFVNLFNWAAHRYQGKVASWNQMNPELAHRIYAGADLFLMPSAFEPCGLSQMIAMRYGTVPIVRETGGLKDTVQPFNPVTGEGVGFTFYSYNAHDMLDAVTRATTTYREDKKSWRKIVGNGMRGDYSWQHSAKKYMELYNKLAPEQAVPLKEEAKAEPKKDEEE